MKNFDAVVAAIHTYGVVPSTHGFPCWYVYRTVNVEGGEVPADSLTFFDKGKASRACDELNARAVIEMWRYG